MTLRTCPTCKSLYNDGYDEPGDWQCPECDARERGEPWCRACHNSGVRGDGEDCLECPMDDLREP